MPKPSAPASLPRAPKPPVESTHDDTALVVLRQFRLVFNAVKTHFRQVEREAGIGGAQLWALSLVRETPGLSVSALAEAMDIHQTTSSNLVKGLLALRLVETHRNGIDRRATLLKVTPAGTRLLRKAPGPFTGVLPQALAQLDPPTLERLRVDLDALLGVLHPDRRAAKIPLAQL